MESIELQSYPLYTENVITDNFQRVCLPRQQLIHDNTSVQQGGTTSKYITMWSHHNFNLKVDKIGNE